MPIPAALADADRTSVIIQTVNGASITRIRNEARRPTLATTNRTLIERLTCCCCTGGIISRASADPGAFDRDAARPRRPSGARAEGAQRPGREAETASGRR